MHGCFRAASLQFIAHSAGPVLDVRGLPLPRKRQARFLEALDRAIDLANTDPYGKAAAHHRTVGRDLKAISPMRTRPKFLL